MSGHLFPPRCELSSLLAALATSVAFSFSGVEMDKLKQVWPVVKAWGFANWLPLSIGFAAGAVVL
jgi:hypothetical protein